MKAVILALLGLPVVLCLSGCATTSPAPETCADYAAIETSPYVLPYTPGTAHQVVQGNCAAPHEPWTHFGVQRYAYDFAMPIGTPIVAARAGTVVFVLDTFLDTQHGKNQGNALVILHDDGTYALYGHLTAGGARVHLGQIIHQGEVIALSGNSGQSPLPHLHFQVSACGDLAHCPTLPISFRNVAPATPRLSVEAAYSAE